MSFALVTRFPHRLHALFWLCVGSLVACRGHHPHVAAKPPAKEQLYPTPGAPPAAAPIPPIRLGLTISGGVSLGAYEAGVGFALISGLRHYREGDATLRAFPAQLEAVTGASAGTINAVLATLAYCATKPHTVKDNPFANAWLPIGWQRLFPGQRSCSEYQGDLVDPTGKAVTACTGNPYASDDGLLSRKGLAAAETWLKSELARGADYRADCSMFIGATVTKESEEMVAAGTLQVPTQRLAVLLEAKVSPKTGWTFTHPTAKPSEFVGPQLDIGLLGQRGVATDDVVDMIEAASAFPVAFGMKRLTYCAGGGAWPADDCAKENRTTARFFDGGLYDNVPIGLAHALLDRKPEPGLSLLYIDPDELRHDVVHAPPGAGSAEGLPLLLELAGRFVTVARKYELQNVARQLGLATNGAVPIDPVNRFSPIMGTHFRSFGAFVARPFRQYDYYVGIYDGLWSLATRVCAVTPQPTNRQKLECVLGEVLRLQKAIGLEDADSVAASAHWVLRQLLKEETTAALRSAEQAENLLASLGASPDHFEAVDDVTKSLFEANLEIHRRLHVANSPRRDPTLAEFYEVSRKVAGKWPADQKQQQALLGYTLSEDEVSFFDNPESWVFRSGRELSLRALQQERTTSDDGVGKLVWAAGGLVVHAYSPHRAGDVLVNARAYPDTEFFNTRTLNRLLLPYEVAWRVVGAGLDVGHVFGFHLGQNWALVAPLRWLSKVDDQIGFRLGLRLSSPSLPILRLLSFDAGVNFGSPNWRFEGDFRGGPELGVSLARFVRFSVSFDDVVGKERGGAFGHRSFHPEFRFGLVDIPSLTYWAAKALF